MSNVIDLYHNMEREGGGSPHTILGKPDASLNWVKYFSDQGFMRYIPIFPTENLFIPNLIFSLKLTCGFMLKRKWTKLTDANRKKDDISSGRYLKGTGVNRECNLKLQN